VPARKGVPSVAKASDLRQLYGASEGTPLHSQQARSFLAAVAASNPLIERASGVLAVALDFDFLFAVRVLAIVAAIFFVLRNYTLALRIPALLVLISHGHFPFGDDVD
jgi:hypothetical protein